MGTITATTDDLASALGTVIHAASRDETRAVLHGVLLEPHRGGLRLVAADNYRISVHDIPGAADAGLILRLEDAVSLHKALKAERTATGVTLAWGDDLRVTASWADGYQSVTLHGVDGAFPDYERAIPPDDREGDAAIGLAAVYIAEAVRALAPGRPDRFGNFGNSGNVRVTVNANTLAPVIVRPADPDSAAFEVIMPVRLS